jgi:hypothetical protein
VSAMNDSFLDDMQQELVALLKSDEVLGGLPILDERLGDIIRELNKNLGVYNDVAGKLGACVIVQSPTAEDDMPAAAGGVLDSDWTILVCEDPTVNDGPSGHQKRALKIVRRIVRVVKLYAAQGLCTALVPLKPCIRPAIVDGVPLAYQARFRTTEQAQGTNAKVAQPTIAPASGVAPQVVTITCATAGAAIYYTLDGSPPWSGNAQANLYAAPVNVAAAGTLRARAFKAGMIGSNAAAGQYT